MRAVRRFLCDDECSREVLTGLVMATDRVVRGTQVAQGDAFEAAVADLAVDRQGGRDVRQHFSI